MDQGGASGKLPRPSTAYASLPVVSQNQNESKFQKLTQYFECLRNQEKTDQNPTAQTPDDQIGLDNRNSEHNCHSCDISNSSLKDVEKGAIEDELGAYINELRSRKI
ncbi:hypothetical protein GWI33_021901 [Rhynchophorus ferrugineus]|nr:hypothetical protein GWI33_021902 [Rhynchophorus ferrugineus]KAF7264941.1 hypothetical protein GWI33_021901 [Rhynchophorus ferrugineus]